MSKSSISVLFPFPLALRLAIFNICLIPICACSGTPNHYKA
jgi:hypothetical protein